MTWFTFLAPDDQILLFSAILSIAMFDRLTDGCGSLPRITLSEWNIAQNSMPHLIGQHSV
jgi:hypothetical protein